MFSRNFRHAGSGERELPCHEMVECRPQAVNIASDIHLLADQVFRADILRRSHHLFIIVQIIFFPCAAGQSEIGQLGLPGIGKHDIVGFDVSVNQPLLFPRIIQRLRDLLDDLNRLVDRDHMVALQDRLHRFAVDVLHGEIVNSLILADRVRLHNMRMIQFCRRPRLLDESDDKLRIVRIRLRKHLECGRTVERNLMRKIHNPHSAPSDLLLNDEIGDHRTGRCPACRNGHNLLAFAALDPGPHLGIVHRDDLLAVRTLKTHDLCSFSRSKTRAILYNRNSQMSRTFRHEISGKLHPSALPLRSHSSGERKSRRCSATCRPFLFPSSDLFCDQKSDTFSPSSFRVFSTRAFSCSSVFFATR